MVTAGRSQLWLAAITLALLLCAVPAARLRASAPQDGEFDVLGAIQAEVETMNTNLDSLSAAIDSLETTTVEPSTTTSLPTTNTDSPTSTKVPTTTAPPTTKATTTKATTTKATTTKATTTKATTTKATTTKATTTQATTTKATTEDTTTEVTTTEATTTATMTTKVTTPEPSTPASTAVTSTVATTEKTSTAITNNDDDKSQLFISRQHFCLKFSDIPCSTLNLEDTLENAQEALNLVIQNQFANTTLESLQKSNIELNFTTSCVERREIIPDNTTAIKMTISAAEQSGETASNTIDTIVNPPTPAPEDDSGFRAATIALSVLFSLSVVALIGMAIYTQRQKSGGHMS